MTMQELAHAAQQTLQARAGCDVKRSHVYELIAGAFGFSSWAGFISDSVLTDAGVGSAPVNGLPQVAGRAMHLRYASGAASSLASALLEFVAERRLSAISWTELSAALAPVMRPSTDDAQEDEDNWEDDEEDAASTAVKGLVRDNLLRSPLLVHNLEHAAQASNPGVHHLLAVLYRCKRPKPYLYEESLKGRTLNATERRWVDEYLRLEPQFRKYETHLKAAALGGVRAAALEYAAAFDSREFFDLAERLSGDVDADRMAELAPTQQSRISWLRTAAEQGSISALEQLAAEGDNLSQERLAESGDVHHVRIAAERALARGDSVTAWVWQYVALKKGDDLTHSTMAAYHDGGQRDGEFYDSDFVGAAYADGDEGLTLPNLSSDERIEAKARAREINGRSPFSGRASRTL